MKGFTTKAVHGVQIKKDVHGSLRMPVYDNVAFCHESARDIQLAFEAKKAAHSYSRITNPTVEDFEQRIRLISGGQAVLAVSSGMAAISNVILTLASSGTNIVTSKYLFGNTFSFFEKTMKSWGLEARYVSMTDPDEIDQAINGKTRAVFLENITNPQLEIADIKTISEITKSHDVPLIVDCTMTTPYIFKSKDFGVNIEILSSTKYISGGATSVGGIIIDNGNFDWKKSSKLEETARKMGPMALAFALRREVYRNVGACMSPHNAYLQSLGLETLAMRIEKSCSNALDIAKYLEKHEKIASINYPGLTGSPFHEIAKKQFGNNFGGILTFDLDSIEACFDFIDAVKLIKRATNINDNKTLILHPSTTIFCEYPADLKVEMGVRPTTIRLSVGIEDIEDILEDLDKGLEVI